MNAVMRLASGSLNGGERLAVPEILLPYQGGRSYGQLLSGGLVMDVRAVKPVF